MSAPADLRDRKAWPDKRIRSAMMSALNAIHQTRATLEEFREWLGELRDEKERRNVEK